MYAFPRGFGALALIPALLFATGCGSSGGGDPTDPGGGGQTPAISNVQLSVSSLDVTAGGSGGVTVTISRAGGFTGTVTVSADVPDGVTAQPVTIGAGSTQGTLTFQVAAGTAAGTLSATIRVTGSGVQEVTRPLSIVVAAVAAGDFGLSLNPTSVEFSQGGSASTSVTINRTGGFSGAVSLTVEGLPQGVTGAFQPNPATGGSSTLTLTAAAGASTGSLSLTVRGEASGVSARTASLGLTVAATGGGGSGNVTWAFCDLTGIPIWLAYQDGNGPWTRVQGDAQHVYRFQIDAARGGIAYVTQEGGVSHTLVFYYSREELLAIGSNQCDGIGGTKTVNGSVTGLGPTDMAFVSLGSASGTAVGAEGPNFSLNNVVDGPQDLVASRVRFDIGTLGFTNDRLLVRRGINPPDGSTLPPLDFDGEGFAPATAQVNVNGLAGGEQSMVVGLFMTDRGGLGAYSFSMQPGGASQTYSGLPTDRLEPGDLHFLQVVTTNLSQGAGEQPPDTRQVGLAFRTVENRSVTLGPQLNMPTITSVGGAAARLRAQWTLQNEYRQFAFASFNQFGTGLAQSRSFTLGASTGFLTGMGSADLEVPDFSGVSGWNAAWALQPGVSTNWTVSGSGWSGGGSGLEVNFPNLVEGTAYYSATRSGQVTP